MGTIRLILYAIIFLIFAYLGWKANDTVKNVLNRTKLGQKFQEFDLKE